MRNLLAELQKWFLSNCDGDWEHGNGVRIETLDNPGWSIWINLIDTKLDGKVFERLEKERSESDWVVCWVEERTFKSACGPENLEEALQSFLDWSNSN